MSETMSHAIGAAFKTQGKSRENFPCSPRLSNPDLIATYVNNLIASAGLNTMVRIEKQLIALGLVKEGEFKSKDPYLYNQKKLS